MFVNILILAAVALTSARPADESGQSLPALQQAPSAILPNGCPADFNIHHLLTHEECSKYYQCVSGQKIERQCAPGTLFNYAIQDCDWPQNVQCANSSTQPPTPAPTQPPTTTPAPTQPPTTTPAPTTPTPAPTQPPTQAPSQILPNGCPADFNIHHLLTHEECNKYYQCVSGQKIERQCAPGTLFNYAIQDCDWPQNVQCANLSTQPPTTSTPASTQPPTKPTTLAPTQPPTTPTPAPTEPTTLVPTQPPTTPTPAPTQPPTKPTTSAPTQATTQAPSAILPNGCPADFNIHHLLPHEECNKFYYCVFGEKVERQCAPGTYFNYAIQVCDWPQNVQCANPPTQPPTPIPTQPPTKPTTLAPTQPPTETPTPAPTQATTQAPSEILPNGCPADFDIHHLLPHEECHKYYQCVSGQKVERQCAPGTYFNYAIQDCDWPENVHCLNPPTQPPTKPTTLAPTQPPTEPPTPAPTQATTQAPSVILPNGCPADFDIHHLLPHEECHKYYQCVSGQKVERQCAPGTYFNYAIQDCDWPENVQCLSPPTQPPTSTTSVPTQPPTNTTTPAPTQATTQAPSVILPNGCPADFDIHHLLPHEECHKYYQCVSGQKVERQCAPGTYFNYAIQDCDWPENVHCLNPPTQPPTKPTTLAPTQPPTEPPTPAPTQATTQAPSAILPNGCPADFDIHHLLPHEECNKFYYCVFGEKVERQCAPGTYFNYAIQVCDWPQNVQCANPPTPAPTQPPTKPTTLAPTQPPTETPTPPPTQPPTETPTPAPTQATTQAPSEILPNGCPADFNIHHLLPHKECHKYYQCVFGQTVERQCAPGTYFNYAIQDCDWPENVHCLNPPTQPPTKPTTLAPTQPPTETPTPPPTQPPTETPTPAPTQATTQAPSEILPNGCPADFNIHHLLPHEECHKYYQCVFGQTVERQCAPETYFNYAIQDCDWPENVQCENGGGGGENGGGENGGNENEKCKSCNVLPWAHEDCDKFWRCDGEKAVLTVCAEGLHFNPNSTTCDFICNAGCVRDEAQATMGASGIKIFLPWDKLDSKIERIIDLTHHENRQ